MEEKKYSEKEVIEWMGLYLQIHHEQENLDIWQIAKSVSERVLKVIPRYKEKVPEEIRTALDSSDKACMNVNNLEERCQSIVDYKSRSERALNYCKTKFFSKKS